MENIRKIRLKKQTLLLVGLGVALSVSIYAVSTTSSYLYRSRADENPDILKVEQDSIAVIPIDMRQYSCVRSLSYLPDDKQGGCFAQFECNSTPDTNLPEACSQRNETISCISNLTSCKTRQEWIDQARGFCGC